MPLTMWMVLLVSLPGITPGSPSRKLWVQSRDTAHLLGTSQGVEEQQLPEQRKREGAAEHLEQ